MAERGAPLGNNNAGKNKPWAEAVRKALMMEDPIAKRKRIELLANRLVDKALEGDVSAIKEIGDRVDGKPAQTISGDPDAPLLFGTVRREIVDPNRQGSEKA